MAGLTGEEAYILARKYTQNTVMGGGAVVGKNVVVKKIAPIDGGNRVTFGYTLDDGTEKESTLDVMDGVSPDIKENDGNTSDTYKLDIIDKNGTITTPNLKGEKGNQGEQGLRGEPGQRGERGEQGLPGVPGPQGIQGERGDRGADGYPFLIYKEYSNIDEFQDSDFPEVGLMFMVKDEDDPEGYPVYRFLGEEAEGDHYSLITRLGKSQAIKGDKGEPGERGERGEQGLPGEPGRDGVDGKDGTTYVPAIGTVTAGKSVSASVGIDEDKKLALFNFVLPDGETVIDDVKVNGQSLPIAEDKSVDVPVPTKVSDLTNDSDYETKAEVSKQLEDYATTAAVDEKLDDYALSSDVSTQLQNYALVSEAGYGLGLIIDNSTYIMTFELKNKAGEVLATESIDFPIESMIVDVDFDKETQTMTITLQNGKVLKNIPLSSLVGGLVKETFTIAGIDMKDNIEAQELITALGLSDVATSGSYNDLIDKPNIPAAAKNGTLTILKNGEDVATFSADQDTNETANIEVPSKTSELENDSGFYDADHQPPYPVSSVNGKTGAVTLAASDVGAVPTGSVLKSKSEVMANSTEGKVVDATVIKELNSGSGNFYKNTLTAGQTEISLDIGTVTETTLIDIYTSVIGVNPTKIEQTGTTIKLTFTARDADMTVAVATRDPVYHA